MPEMMIPLSEIDLENSIQVRSAPDHRAIDEYAEHWSAGGDFPAVVLYRVDGALLLADGWHRVMAVEDAEPRKALVDVLGGEDEPRSILAEVREGTYDDYLQAAMAANLAHGVRLNNQDKRRIVELALKQWPELSAREIAERVNHVVSHELVNTVRNEIDEAARARSEARKAKKEQKAKGEPAAQAADPKLELVLRMAKSVQAAFENLSSVAKRAISTWELDRLKDYRAEEAAEILQEIAADYKTQLTISSARYKILQRRIDSSVSKGGHAVLTLSSVTDWAYVRGVMGPKAALALHLVGATKRDWAVDARLDRKDKQGPCYFVPEHLIGPFLADSTSGDGVPFTRLELLMSGDQFRGLTVRVVEKYGRLIESTEIERIESTVEDRLSGLIAEHKDQGPILDLSGTAKVAALAKHHGATLWSLCETEAQAALVREALGLDGDKPASKKPSLSKAAKAAAKPAAKEKGKAARPPKGKAPAEPAPEAEAVEAPAEPEAISA